MKTKLVTLPIALLALAALSGCNGTSQAGNESTASEAPPPTAAEGSTTSGTRTEESAGNGGSGETVTLEIEGGPGTEVSGSCTVGDGEPEEIGGQVPRSFGYALGDEPLDCEIASEDAIEVNLTADGTRSVQRISGGTLNLTYENGSVSSSTSSYSVSSSSSSSVSSQSSSSRVSGAEASGAAEGSGDVASETRNVSGFDEVELRGVGDLSIRQTGEESLTVEAEEGVLPKIATEVVDGRLVIGPEPNTNIQTTRPIDYELSVEDLRALEVSGSGDVNAEGIDTDNLEVTITGSGAVEMGGRADSQNVSVSGSGNYRALELESKQAKVDVEGAGSALVNASDTLDATVGGAGSVEYAGDPAVEQDVSGAGRVSKR